MNLEGRKVTVHDMSLRDGMHPKRHQITVEQMRQVARGMDEAGVPLIEVTHGDGLGGASVNYGFPAASDEEYLRAVIPELKQTKVSALLLARFNIPLEISGRPQQWIFGMVTL